MLNSECSVLDILNLKNDKKKLEDCTSCSKGWYTCFLSGKSRLQISTPILAVIIRMFPTFLRVSRQMSIFEILIVTIPFSFRIECRCVTDTDVTRTIWAVLSSRLQLVIWRHFSNGFKTGDSKNLGRVLLMSTDVNRSGVTADTRMVRHLYTWHQHNISRQHLFPKFRQLNKLLWGYS
jgi:hypothetical protein